MRAPSRATFGLKDYGDRRAGGTAQAHESVFIPPKVRSAK